jgi:hypothetical protein
MLVLISIRREPSEYVMEAEGRGFHYLNGYLALDTG